MIASFRTTVELWLDQTMRGDIYIGERGFSGTRLDTPLDPKVIALAGTYLGTEASLFIRVVTVESEEGSLELVAASMDRPMDPRLFLDVQENPQHAWQMVREGAILLSEPLANRLGISASGGSLKLLTPMGWQPFPIAGIYADYASTRGTVRMSLETYRRLWNDERLNERHQRYVHLECPAKRPLVDNEDQDPCQNVPGRERQKSCRCTQQSRLPKG